MKDLTKELLNGFCHAILANEEINGYGNVTLQIIEENGRFYASLGGVVGVDEYTPGDYYREAEGGNLTYGEIEKIDLSGTFSDCGKDFKRFFIKLQTYFADVCTANYKNLYA